MSAGWGLATSSAAARASCRKVSFLLTKSVSLLTSISAPRVPSIWQATTPSEVIRAGALAALAMSPPASVSAFLHSIIGASVLPRSSATMLAVIADICLPSGFSSSGYCGEKKGAHPGPRFGSRLALGLGSHAALRPSGRRLIDLDELVRALGSPRFGHFVDGVGTAFDDRVGDAAGVQRHGLGRAVVAGDHIVDAFGRMVGVDHTDQRNAQFLGFGHGDLVETHVDDEDRVGQCAHVLYAADVFFELVDFAREGQLLFLAQAVEPRFLLGLHVLEPLDRGLDGLEVGQHAAEPALVDERHAGAQRLGGQDFTGLALGADHQNRATVGRQLPDELLGLLEQWQRLFQVDDVDLVAVAEDIGGHLGVPEAGLVTEVDTGFQHFAHADGHENTP